MVEHLDDLEVGAVAQRQHHVAGAEARVDAAVEELLAEQVTEATGGARQSVRAGGVREMVQAHTQHSHPGREPRDTGGVVHAALVQPGGRVKSENTRRHEEAGHVAARQGAASGGKGGAPVADRAEAIRNVAVVGPAGSGKTTLVETLLVSAGVLNRAGAVAEGTTVCDFDEAEHRQQRSVGLALAPLMHDGVKVNLLDTPGYADFVGELRAGLRAADCAMFVVAANEGVDEPTRTLWRECAEVVDAAGRGDHQARPRPRRLRRRGGRGPGGVRRQGGAGLPARGRSAGRPAHRTTTRTTSSAAP